MDWLLSNSSKIDGRLNTTDHYFWRNHRCYFSTGVTGAHPSLKESEPAFQISFSDQEEIPVFSCSLNLSAIEKDIIALNDPDIHYQFNYPSQRKIPIHTPEYQLELDKHNEREKKIKHHLDCLRDLGVYISEDDIQYKSEIPDIHFQTIHEYHNIRMYVNFHAHTKL